MITPNASDRTFRSRPAIAADATEPPSPRISTAANCELPPNTNNENPIACRRESPAVAAAAPNTMPNGATEATIEAA